MIYHVPLISTNPFNLSVVYGVIKHNHPLKQISPCDDSTTHIFWLIILYIYIYIMFEK